MRAAILNRDFQHPSDGLYQIETPGEHPNADGGVIQIIDRTAVASIVNRFNAEADDYKRRTGNPFPGMLIDIEHFKHDQSKETRAYGWLLRMENPNGVPFGEIKWTATGRESVDGGDYRFFSTEYDPQDLTVLNRGNPERVRPMRLDGLTLTNMPNNKGGAPITNRGGSQAPQAGNGQSVHLPQEITMREPNEPPLATKALDEWFIALRKVNESSRHFTASTLGFQTLWNLAKKTFPKEYAAAFGNDTDTIADSGDGVKMNPANGADLLNRIKVSSRISFASFPLNFVRENLPRIYNRMLPQRKNSAIAIDVEHPSRTRERAGKLFNRLVTEAQASGKFASLTWSQVVQAEKTLCDLAAGRITPDEAFSRDPELRKRLANTPI